MCFIDHAVASPATDVSSRPIGSAAEGKVWLIAERAAMAMGVAAMMRRLDLFQSDRIWVRVIEYTSKRYIK
jgi:hypothetical protein